MNWSATSLPVDFFDRFARAREGHGKNPPPRRLGFVPLPAVGLTYTRRPPTSVCWLRRIPDRRRPAGRGVVAAGRLTDAGSVPFEPRRPTVGVDVAAPMDGFAPRVRDGLLQVDRLAAEVTLGGVSGLPRVR